MRQIKFEFARGAHGFETRAAFFKTLAGDVGEVRIGGLALGDVEAGEGILDFFELDAAALSDFPGAVDGVFEFTEQRHHLGARFDVKIGVVPVHALGVRHGLPGLDAHEDFMGAGVFAAQVMRVVGGYERDAGFDGEAVDLGDEALILFEAVVLNFEEEIVFAEHLAVGVGEAAGIIVFIVEDSFVEIAAEAGGEADEAFGVRGEHFLIDARLVVKAFEEGRGNHLDEVAVAFLVFAEEDEVVITVGFRTGLVALG